MEIYKLSQKVEVGINHFEWVDISTDTRFDHLQEYARKIKEKNPNAILGMRRIVETEIDIGI